MRFDLPQPTSLLDELFDRQRFEYLSPAWSATPALEALINQIIDNWFDNPLHAELSWDKEWYRVLNFMRANT